jgi:hypothetical protein
LEVVIGYNKHHTETCPKCLDRIEDDGSDADAPTMERLSPCCYRCPECECIVLSGWDRYKMSKRMTLT